MDRRIKEIIIEIEENLSKPLKIRTLSNSKGLSVSRFQHLFKQEVKMSFTNFIQERRLQKACEMLEATHLRVQEVLVKVGAPNENHFLRDFKKRFGKTPINYRKNCGNGRNGY